MPEGGEWSVAKAEPQHLQQGLEDLTLADGASQDGFLDRVTAQEN